MSKVAISALVIAALVAAIFLLPFPRRAVFCSQLINPWELAGSYTVSVPADRHKRFNDELATILLARGLKTDSGQMEIAEVRNSGNQYSALQSIACDGLTFVWSGNDLHPDEFGVTFHRNRLFGSDEAAAVARAFKADFSKRYSVRDGVGWQPETHP